MDCNFLEQFMPCIDEIRSIHDVIGDRPWKVYIVTKKWTGSYQNEGGLIEHSRLLLEPSPKIEGYNEISGRWESRGLAFDGQLRISEISSRYVKGDIEPSIPSQLYQNCIEIVMPNETIEMTIDRVTFDTYRVPGWMVLGKVK